MKVNEQTSILQDIPFHASPNYDDRPEGKEISLIVVHGISLPPEDFGSGHVHDFFMNQLDVDFHPYFTEIEDLKVSCHLFIERNGQIHQYVPFNKRAWHAGKSMFNGAKNCNDFSIGIELEGTDHTKYTDEQYKSLVECTKTLIDQYKIPIKNIKGHSDIAPQRKSDPGESFDWNYYKQKLT
jgi:AmpD protein